MKFNSKQLGNITEVSVMLAFLKLGYNILTPYGDCERYDFVADINGKFYRIQVKTSKEEEGKIEMNTASTNYVDGKCIHHSYSKDEIDYIATIYNDKCYLIPVEICGKRTTSLRLIPAKNGQTRGVKMAKDYELEEVIKSLG